MTLDRRSVRILVLLTWSGFLVWLWASGETVRYLGPRTTWLVPFGAIALALAAILYARAPASAEPSPRLGRAELVGFAALILPIVAGMLLANTQLGALAASKKLTSRGIDPTALAELAARNGSGLSFLQLKVAEHNAKFAGDNDIRPGKEVRLLGFVAKSPGRSRSSFELARFYITCCVADSVPIGIVIESTDPNPPAFGRDDWLNVSGEIVRRGESLRVRATKITRAEAPSHPYLSFSY